MIDLAALRQDPDAFKKSQAARGESVELVDQVITADAARRTALGEFESLRANQKAIGTSRLIFGQVSQIFIINIVKKGIGRGKFCTNHKTRSTGRENWICVGVVS